MKETIPPETLMRNRTIQATHGWGLQYVLLTETRMYVEAMFLFPLKCDGIVGSDDSAHASNIVKKRFETTRNI